MNKSEKKRCKQTAPNSNSIIAKYRHDDGEDDDDDEDNTEQWRKYRQGRNLPHDRSERKHSKPPIDTTLDYHEMSRLRKHHLSSSKAFHGKYQIPSVPEEVYRADEKNRGILRALKYYPNNFAVVRKFRYKDDEDEETKYVDKEPEDDNPEEETCEEIVDEEHEDISEYSDKDYEEHEADDEVDEESDILEAQVERLKTQRKIRHQKNDPPTRTQKIGNIEPSHYHNQQKIGTDKNLQRCCHVIDERDNVDLPTEDDEEHRDLCEETIFPTKKTTWRYHDDYHRDRESRTVPRNAVERFSSPNKMASASVHQNGGRRPRTTRPEVESSRTLARLQHGPIRNNRCSQCGVLTGQKPKMSSIRNADCGLHDTRYFTKIPFGDEGDYYEDPVPISYQSKPRRSKQPKTPDYDHREESRLLDAEIGAIYKSCRTKIPRDLSNDHVERTRNSTRINNRHDPILPSKNDNRYRK